MQFYRPLIMALIGLMLIGRLSLAEKPRTADDAVAEGNAMLTAKKYDAAIVAYTEAIQLDPKNAVAYAERGLAFLAKDKFPAPSPIARKPFGYNQMPARHIAFAALLTIV